MKKNYFFSILSLISFTIVGQNIQNSYTIPPPESETEWDDDKSQLDSDFYKKLNFNSKKFGDTLFYTDFNGGLPSGWTIQNNNPNNFQWSWDTTYLQGQFSSTRTKIKSTTAANGFMSLPSDFYNTPTPATGRVNMDTYFESDTITIIPKPSVWVSYQQYVRYCCNSSNDLVLRVSTDNFITWTEFDAINALPVNAGNTSNAVGGRTNIINISTAVANASQFKIRFYAEGNGRYFWMIDDFAIVEGVENDLELRDPYMEFNEANYDYYPFYGQIPYDLFPALPFFGRIYNNGSNTQTNVKLEATVNHIAFPNGTPGTGLIYANNSSPITMVSGSISDSAVPVLTGSPRFVPLVLGEFSVNFLATGDSLDDNIGNEIATAGFLTTDTIFARDDNSFGGGTGPGSYVRNNLNGGQLPGDAFGTMYIVESRTGNGGLTKVPTSVTYRVSNDTSQVGMEIVPKLWEYDDDSLRVGGNFSVDRAFGAELAGAFIPYTIQLSDINSFLTLAFDNGSGFFSGLDTGQYVVGWEVINTNGGNNFEVLNDASSAALQVNVSTFNNLAHDPRWSWVDVNPGIRLNFGNMVVTGLDKTSSSPIQFEISPNPNNGQFKIQLNSKSELEFTMSVRNTLGQTISIEQIAVKGYYTKQLDLRQFERGVYFVCLESKNEKLIKKVVVQ
ncbi:MAG: T9SS type A sorting domain-containing protein [Flavobacteriales bacterium]|nr:T9SS type A sorting domain-containing protein [Flavobacteriales bacterium]